MTGVERPDRRTLLAAAGVLALSSQLACSRARQRRFAELARRRLGGTGRELPCLGLGGFPFGNVPDRSDGVAVVQRAWETGARYFDTAPSYTQGESERRLGRGLAGLPREELYVATKTLERDGDAALAELEQSLERLGMDYVDSVQVHELHGDLDAALAPGGVVPALLDARERGRVRHIGFSCHRDPGLALEALARFEFATALVPVNPLDPQHRSFIRDVLPAARSKGVGVIAMKVFAGGQLVKGPDRQPAGELVRFALSQEGVCVAIPGAASVREWDEAREAAALGPLPPAEQEALRARVGTHEGKDSEWYKDA